MTDESGPGPGRKVKHAVIVLGAGVRPDGTPSPPLKRRIVAGIELHKSLEDSVLVCAGGVGRFGPSEASVMGGIAIAEGVAKTSIILEEKSRNTRENLQYSISLIRNMKPEILYIVSDHTHIPRCRLYTWLARIPARFHSVPSGVWQRNPPLYLFYLAYEAAGLLKYTGVGLIDRFKKPGFRS